MPSARPVDQASSFTGLTSPGASLCAAPSSNIFIKRAEPSDADALRELFDIQSRTEEGTAPDARGPDLGRPGRMVWMASRGTRAIGMTGVLVRRLSVGHEEIAVAYWTGFFIDPAYRSAFLYPRLFSAMFNGARDAGLTTMYAAVRRQAVDAPLKVGFKTVGDLPVLVKLLRPALFLAKYTKILKNDWAGTCVQAVCRLPDAFFAWGTRLFEPRVLGPWRVREGTWSGSTVTGLAELYESDGMIQAGQHWTVDMLLARYGSAQHEYRVMEVRRGNRVVAAAIVRIVDRRDAIRAAVIMDLIHEPEAVSSGQLALDAVERLARAAGCDVVLYLEGGSAASNRLLRRRGYRASSERYSLLLWTDPRADTPRFPMDPRNWRVTFADHDTF